MTPGVSDPTPVREGDILAGKFRIDRVLGRGGMGVVVAAHHIHLDEKVAIKFLLPETLGNREAVARFAREARAAVKIKSEHVARVSDVGTLQNGAPYMVMEYLEGGDLANWLEQRGPLEPAQAVEFVLQACEAIAEAHALGIVHRDLKPANLFVVRRADGVLSVKVLDFGISKLTGVSSSSQDASITKTSNLMGSPLYMSPEQIQSSKHVDTRCDIWALGVILYELLAGHSPFNGDSLPEIIFQIVSTAPTPLRDYRADAPDGLESVILRCLEKDRGERYGTVAELARALLPFAPKRSRSSVDRISGVMRSAGLGEEPTALTSPPSSEGLLAGASVSTAGNWTQTSSRPSSNKAAVSVGFALGIGLAGVGAFLAFGRGTGTGTAILSSSAASGGVSPSAEGATPVGAPSTAEPAKALSLDAPPPPPAEAATAVASPPAAPPAVAPRREPRTLVKSPRSPSAVSRRISSAATPTPPLSPTSVATASPPVVAPKAGSKTSLIDDRR